MNDTWKNYIQQMKDDLANTQQFAVNLMQSCTSAVSSSLTNSIMGIIDGTMTWKEAVNDLGRSILQSIVGALVQIGVEWMALKVLEAAGWATTTAASTAAAVATASAWAAPAAEVSLATLGVNAAPAAVALTSTHALSQGLALMSAIPALAEGGVEYGYKPTLAQVYDSPYGEAVIPLSRNRRVPVEIRGGAAGGGDITQITIASLSLDFSGIRDVAGLLEASPRFELLLLRKLDDLSRRGALRVDGKRLRAA